MIRALCQARNRGGLAIYQRRVAMSDTKSVERKTMVRTYGMDKLECDITPGAYFSERKDMCVFPKTQVLGGVTFPWGTIAYFNKDLKTVRIVQVQSLSHMGGLVKFQGVDIYSALYAFFHANGKLSQINQWSLGPNLPNKWDHCCKLGYGCSLLFTSDGAFDHCEAYEMQDGED